VKASSVVGVAKRWGWVKLHTGVVHLVAVGIAVEAAVPIVAVTHAVEGVGAVRMVVLTLGSRRAVAVHPVMAGAPSDPCSWVITSFVAEHI
jgi:hypothetical protein